MCQPGAAGAQGVLMLKYMLDTNIAIYVIKRRSIEALVPKSAIEIFIPGRARFFGAMVSEMEGAGRHREAEWVRTGLNNRRLNRMESAVWVKRGRAFPGASMCAV